MYVRSVVAKGHTYYRIVEGVREGPKVRQRIVLSLGRESDPRRALKQWKRSLDQLQRERARWPSETETSKTTARRIERLDAQISDLKTRIFELTSLIKVKLIGTTNKVTGTMERITAECGATGLAFQTNPRRKRGS
jgi:hypothetical protein